MTNTQPNKTSFQRKYTEEQVLDQLKKNNIMSARQISDKMGCHKKTVESLIKKLLESDSIALSTVDSMVCPIACSAFSICTELLRFMADCADAKGTAGNRADHRIHSRQGDLRTIALGDRQDLCRYQPAGDPGRASIVPQSQQSIDNS